MALVLRGRWVEAAGVRRVLRASVWARRGIGALVGGCLFALAPGCSSRVRMHPALKLDQSQIEKAKERGKALIKKGASPYQAYGPLMKQANVRVSAHVILREAGACWPAQELIFEIAQQGDASDAGIQRAASQAVRRLERELKFVAVVQVPQGRDPAEITFGMRADRSRLEYPPIVVLTPVHLRDLASGLDMNVPAAGLWSYDVWFPISGGPGYPAVDEGVRSLCLVVKDGESQAEWWFDLPRATARSRP